LIVLWVTEALGKGLDVFDAAVAVELFHTSSLIADDLPIMDDEEFRRGKLTTHKKYGETTALLASYALIAYSYELIGKNAETYRKQTNSDSPVCEAALKAISSCAGLNGVMTGQLMDLSPPDQTIETIFEIIYLKTTTLFEASFSLGFIFGGGDLSLIEDLKKAAYHLGKAFQVADDIQDSKKIKRRLLILILQIKSAFKKQSF